MNTMQLGPEAPGPDTKRLLIAVVASSLLFFVWQSFFVTPPPPKTADVSSTTGPAPSAETPSPGETPKAVEAVAATPAQVPAQIVELGADVARNIPSTGQFQALRGGYRARVTNQGAQLAGFALTGYTDPHGTAEAGAAQAIELVPPAGAQGAFWALRARGADVALSPTDGYELVSKTDAEVVFSRMTPAGVRVSRTYRFHPDRFGFTHTLQLTNEASSPKTAALELLLSGSERPGERQEGSLFAPATDQLAAVCRAGDERERWLSKDVETSEKLAGAVGYAGIDRHFFLSAVMPRDGALHAGCVVEGWSSQAGGAQPKTQGLTVAVQLQDVQLQPGESKTVVHDGYLGPKQLHALQQAGAGLDENIEFGWFGVLSRPMLWVLVRLYDFIGNFGIAIILLTLLMKAITFPLTQKSYVSMQQMKTIAPEMKKLQEKYGHDRATLGQKQMDLYKEKGINPMAGCFPVLVQMPIWFALYRTLWNSVELFQQPFFGGITDLSQPDHLIFGFPLLPILVGGLMLGQTLMQPPPQDQPQMKYVMWGMPIMFTFFMLQMPSGLSLYMITNSLLTMAQQFYIKRKYST